MAKQRPQPKPKGHSPSASTAGRGTRVTEPSKVGGATSPSHESGRRTTYVEAVALYERGVQALQTHDFSLAQQLLESVLSKYPDEKELHERVRLYLNVCLRQAKPKTPAPRTVDERLYAATLSINGGRFDEAIAHLRLVRDEDPDNDYALYMLAVAHAQRGEHVEALAHLERSIALNPENRALAKRDADFDVLRQDESFQATLDTPARPSLLKRASARPKSTR